MARGNEPQPKGVRIMTRFNTQLVHGLPVNDNVGLEHEADVMGARANSI